MATEEEKRYMGRVASLGCIVCRLNGIDSDAEVHHTRFAASAGKKSSPYLSIPLCPAHHRTSNEAYHHSPKNFEMKNGNEESLLALTIELLHKRGF